MLTTGYERDIVSMDGAVLAQGRITDRRPPDGFTTADPKQLREEQDPGNEPNRDHSMLRLACGSIGVQQ